MICRWSAAGLFHPNKPTGMLVASMIPPRSFPISRVLLIRRMAAMILLCEAILPNTCNGDWKVYKSPIPTILLIRALWVVPSVPSIITCLPLPIFIPVPSLQNLEMHSPVCTMLNCGQETMRNLNPSPVLVLSEQT